jgi:hypothetical protein
MSAALRMASIPVNGMASTAVNGTDRWILGWMVGRVEMKAFLQARRIRTIEDSIIPLIQEIVQRPRC